MSSRWHVLGLSVCTILLTPPNALAQESHLRLVWRQEFKPLPPNPRPIFLKPSSVAGSFVVRKVFQGNLVLDFDESGQLVRTIPVSQVSALYFSPSNTISVLDQLQVTAHSLGSDEGPTDIAAFLNGNQIWQRTTNFEEETIVADSGVSVDLDRAIVALTFYDKQGKLVGKVLPFVDALSWSFERPVYGGFSLDGNTFGLLATTSSAQNVALFLYDFNGSLLRRTDFQDLKVAEAIQLSSSGDGALIIGWTEDPSTDSQAEVLGIVVGGQGQIVRKFRVPSIGDQVKITLDAVTGEFVLDSGSGTFVRVSLTSPPASFSSGTVFSPTAIASNAGLTAIVSLESEDSKEETETDVVLKILDINGTPALETTLKGKTVGLDHPQVWLSQDGKFIAVRFSDEIRYYGLRLGERDDVRQDQR